MSIRPFAKHFYGKSLVLESSSCVEAGEKLARLQQIDPDMDAAEAVHFTPAAMWKEYQLFYLTQRVEFDVCEFLNALCRAGKIHRDVIDPLQNDGRISAERKTDETRLFTPYCLLVEREKNLGALTRIVRDNTDDFPNKSELVTELETFNASRVGFVHRSMTSPFDFEQECATGMTSGLKALELMSSISAGLPR